MDIMPIHVHLLTRMSPPQHTGAPGQQKAALEAQKQSRASEIMSHEQAHSAAAGPYGGAINIRYGADGMPEGGEVPIHMPGLDAQNPEASYQAYQTIFGAAMAPGDPSSQDYAVAAHAQAMMGQAQVLIQQKQQQEGLR